MSGIRINAAAEMLGVSTEHAAQLGAPPRLPPAAPHAGQPPPLRARRGRGAARGAARDPQHLERGRGRPPARPRPGLPGPPARRLRPLRRGRPPTASSRRASRCARSSARVAEVLLPALEMRRAAPERRRRARARLPLGDRLAASAPAASPPAPPAPRACCCSTRARRSASRPSTSRRWSCSCAAPACASCCSPPASPRAASAARLRALRPARRRDLRLRGPARRARRARCARCAPSDGGARLYGYRAARLVAGRDGVPSLGDEPGEATDELAASQRSTPPEPRCRTATAAGRGRVPLAAERSRSRIASPVRARLQTGIRAGEAVASFVAIWRKLRRLLQVRRRGTCALACARRPNSLRTGNGDGYQPASTIQVCAALRRIYQIEKGSWKQAQRFLNVSEAAEFLGVSAASLRKWSDQGLVPVYRTPGRPAPLLARATSTSSCLDAPAGRASRAPCPATGATPTRSPAEARPTRSPPRPPMTDPARHAS